MTNIKNFTNKIDLSEDKESLPEIVIDAPDIIFNENVEDDIKNDYQYSRTKLMYAMAASEAVLKGAVSEMKNDIGPRSIEAFSSLVEVMNKTTDKIFSLHEKMKKIQPTKEDSKKKEDEKKTIKTTVNDIIAQMSTK